jgi:hypothetical protein
LGDDQRQRREDEAPCPLRQACRPRTRRRLVGADRLERVPLDELSRPTPSPRPWFLPEAIKPAAPAPPPTPQALSAKLADRRAALSAALEKYDAATDAVEAAQQLADRAAAVLDDANRTLRRFVDMDRDAADTLVARLRQGVSGFEDDTARRADHERAKREADTAAAAHDRLAGELATTRQAANEADLAVCRAAAVVAAIIERDVEALRAVESAAAVQRAKLKAGCETWLPIGAKPGPPPVHPIAAGYVVAPYRGPQDYPGASSDRQRPFVTLFDRLIAGDAEAEIE